MSTPSIEDALRKHEYLLQYRSGGICTCGFVPDVDASTLQTQQDYHRAHVADAIRAHLAEHTDVLKADAWDEGYEAGSDDQVDAYWERNPTTTPNPYRAALAGGASGAAEGADQ